MTKFYILGAILALTACAGNRARPADRIPEPALSEKIQSVSAPTDRDKRKESPFTADEGLAALKSGNERYLQNINQENQRSHTERRRELEAVQKPHSIVLSCSDSRVPPEIVFDQRLGNVFVVRTAGQALDDNVIASIEYALEHLGSNLILVMGHTSCGAVKAGLAALQGHDLGTPALNALGRDIVPRLQSFKNQSKASEGAHKEGWANAVGVAKDLMTRSALIKAKVEKGNVKIHSALYSLVDGKVEFR